MLEVNPDRLPRNDAPENSMIKSRPLNEYELRVTPDEHSILNEPFLRCTPYIVNRRYMTLICLDCGYCVNPEKALGHLSKHHSECKFNVAKDFALQLSNKFPDLVANAIHPPAVIEPVFGLAIPAGMFTICSHCRRGYVNLDTWRHHDCGRKDIDLEGRPEHFSSLVQTFFRGPKICYFPIQIPALVSDEVSINDFDLFKLGSHDLPVSEDVIEEPEDYRELNQFLEKEGWIKHVSGNSRSELSLLTAPPGDEEFIKPSVAREVIAIMTNIQAAIGRAGYHVRRLIGKRPT